MKNQNWITSFGNAFAGIRRTAYRERNFRIQIFFGIFAVIACIVFRVGTAQFLWVVLAIFFVLSTELLNTAVEAITDLACNKKAHPLAKIAKDAAAGAVLLASLFAVIVALTTAMSVVGRYI